MTNFQELKFSKNPHFSHSLIIFSKIANQYFVSLNLLLFGGHDNRKKENVNTSFVYCNERTCACE